MSERTRCRVARAVRAGVLVGLASLMVALPAAAALVEALSLEQLAARASLILRGTVQSSSSAWDASGRRIVTHTRILVSEVLAQHGPAQAEVGKTLEVRTPGGNVGAIGQSVPGAPRFTPGEEVLLFLEPVTQGWTPVGLALGKFTLRPDDRGVLRAVRDLTGLDTVKPGGGIVEPGSPDGPPDDLPFDDLLEALDRATR